MRGKIVAYTEPRQRGVLSEKLADLGNVAVGSLVFGYVLRSNAFNGYSLLIGVIIALATYGLAVALEK